MRLIGNVKTKQHAERISAFLTTREISTHCELENEEWEIWVRDEDFLDAAKQHLEDFRKDPDAAQYREAVEVAQKIARAKEKKLQEAKSNVIHMTDDRWNAPITKVAPFTVALVVICGIVSLLLTGLGEDRDSATYRALSFCSISNSQADELIKKITGNAQSAADFGLGKGTFDNQMRLASASKGEFWRTITPIFIHFGIWHLLFNMYWLVRFGKQIEYRYSSVWLAILVVLIAVPSNMSQCLVPQSLDGAPLVNFGNHWTMNLGGMSGVIYGLFGYIWMKMIFDPKCGLFLSSTTIMFLMAWLLICMMPGFPMNVGNWAHGMGLVAGLAIGYFPKLLADLGFSKDKDPET